MAKTKETTPAKNPTLMRSVKVEYSDAEITKMAKQMTYAMAEIDGIKTKAKEAAEGFKAQITAKETEISTLSQSVNLGYQMVTCPCELKKNFDDGIREYWYNGKLIDSEPLTANDHQIELNLAEEKNRKEEQKALGLTEEPKEKGNVDEPAKNPEPIVLNEEQQAQYIEFMRSGDEVFKEKNYAEALTYYKAANKLNPSDEKSTDKVLKTQNWLDKVANAEKEAKK